MTNLVDEAAFQFVNEKVTRMSEYERIVIQAYEQAKLSNTKAESIQLPELPKKIDVKGTGVPPIYLIVNKLIDFCNAIQELISNDDPQSGYNLRVYREILKLISEQEAEIERLRE